ncbi:MAG: hypothetical protein WCG95_04020 [bacterium]
MLVLYENHKVSGIKFGFKLDPVFDDFLPHIYIRHLITPEMAIVAYLNISEKKYNTSNKRWESYSKADDITLYYMELSDKAIFIISAFKV